MGRERSSNYTESFIMIIEMLISLKTNQCENGSLIIIYVDMIYGNIEPNHKNLTQT